MKKINLLTAIKALLFIFVVGGILHRFLVQFDNQNEIPLTLTIEFEEGLDEAFEPFYMDSSMYTLYASEMPTDSAVMLKSMLDELVVKENVEQILDIKVISGSSNAVYSYVGCTCNLMLKPKCIEGASLWLLFKDDLDLEIVKQ